MPNKNIYVSEDDLPLFELAQELSGSNLSAAIVLALRRYVELEQAKRNSLNEITVIVNSQGAHRRKRFLGQKLVHWIQPSANRKGTEVIDVYRTAGKRYAVHTHSMPDWKLEFGDPDLVSDPNNWGVGNGILQKILTWGYDWEHFREAGDYSFQVFETLEDLKPHISSDLFKAISQAMEGPDIEDLDI